MHPAFSSFLLRLQTEWSFNPYGTLTLSKLFQPEWSQPQEWCAQTLPGSKQPCTEETYAATIQAHYGLWHLSPRCHPSRHFHCWSPMETNTFSSRYWTQEEITWHLLCKTHWAGRGSSHGIKAPLCCPVTAASPRPTLRPLWWWPMLHRSSMGCSTRSGPQGMHRSRASQTPTSFTKEFILLGLAKSLCTIILNSNNNLAIPELASQTTSRKAESKKTGNYH